MPTGVKQQGKGGPGHLTRKSTAARSEVARDACPAPAIEVPSCLALAFHLALISSCPFHLALGCSCPLRSALPTDTADSCKMPPGRSDQQVPPPLRYLSIGVSSWGSGNRLPVPVAHQLIMFLPRHFGPDLLCLAGLEHQLQPALPPSSHVLRMTRGWDFTAVGSVPFGQLLASTRAILRTGGGRRGLCPHASLLHAATQGGLKPVPVLPLMN